MPANFSPKPKKNLCGSLIRQARLRQKPPLTQDQLSGRLAAHGLILDRTAIAKIECGQRSVYDYELAAIALVLKLDISTMVIPSGNSIK